MFQCYFTCTTDDLISFKNYTFFLNLAALSQNQHLPIRVQYSQSPSYKYHDGSGLKSYSPTLRSLQFEFSMQQLTLLLANSNPIPSMHTWSRPPCPDFMSWTGNSPPSSGPRIYKTLLSFHDKIVPTLLNIFR